MIAVEELERRMRPGAWSEGGFLGHRERLEDVLAADQRTLESLALTRAELVEPLEMLIQASVIVAFELDETLASYLSNEPEMQGARRKGRDAIENRFGKLEPMSSTPENAARLGGRYEIRVLSLRGSQPCPWSPAEFDERPGTDQPPDHGTRLLRGLRLPVSRRSTRARRTAATRAVQRSLTPPRTAG
jgi:hypothetical protein